MFISNNWASFHLWWKEILVKHVKVSKYFENDCRLLVKNHKVERVKSVKFFGVFVDENLFVDEKLSWKDHIKYIEDKVAKNIGLLYRAKLLLDENSLLTLYYSYIHTYLIYANLWWGSPSRTNLKKLLSQQKYAVRITNNRIRFDHTSEFFKLQKILNIYKLNLLSVAVFMYQIRNKTASLTFSGSFEKICHGYPIKFSQFNYKILKPH